ncbi:linear amide C-N hydrolase [bacterium]|nr:linear amide C-N hydrolase [bacterium]
MRKSWFSCFLIALSVSAVFASTANACTRCLYKGPGGSVLVARSMDWEEDPGTEIYVFPRGMSRDGAASADSLKWKSKYGSLVCSFYGVASVDGINEKGLVSNVLYLAESDYGPKVAGRPNISIAAWCQYVLDNFATVAETVEALKKEPFTVIAPVLPNGVNGTGHMAISDPSGDSAIFEYVKGKLVIHHDAKYKIMTNSPTFDEQLALNKYWEQIGGNVMLPGTSRAADRFVRASYLLKSLPQTDEEHKSIASLLSVIRSVSVPLGTSTPGAPNISSTVWRTIYDQKRMVMYFDSAISPTVFWVPVADVDFTEGAGVKRLALKNGESYSGNAASKFAASQQFEFLKADPK